MVEGRVLIAGVMLAIFASMVGLSFAYPAEARFIPLVIGVPGMLLALAQFVIELRSPEKGEFTAEDRKAELRMFGWFVFFLAGIILFGFPYAAPIIVMLYLHFSWREKWYVSLGAGAFAFAALHGVFNYLLGLPLFEGLVVGWFLY